MVEGTGLENRNTRKRIRGSNPLASALGLKSFVPKAHPPWAENLTPAAKFYRQWSFLRKF